MKTLEQIFTIQNVVKIYVPGTINENEPAPELQKVWTSKAVEFMSDLFGGATYGRFTGAWKNDAGQMIEEPQNVVYSFCDGDFSAVLAVVDFARLICREMKQTAVCIEYNGRAGFVGPNPE